MGLILKLQHEENTGDLILNLGKRKSARGVITAELRNRNSSIFYDKGEYVKLLKRAFDNMFPKCMREIDDEKSVPEELLHQAPY